MIQADLSDARRERRGPRPKVCPGDGSDGDPLTHVCCASGMRCWLRSVRIVSGAMQFTRISPVNYPFG